MTPALPRPARRGRRRLALVLGGLLLAACGGGGGGGAPAPPLALGLVSGTQPTVIPQAFRNPRSQPATATLVDATGGFGVAAGQLPAPWPAGAEQTLDVTFTPAGPGPASGSVTLRFTESGGQSSDVTRRFTLDVEAPALTVLTAGVTFEEVLPGTQAEREVEVHNPSLVSTVAVTGVTLADPAFTVATPLPLALAPGQGGTLTVRFEPTQAADFGFVASVLDDAGDGPDTFTVNAFTSGLTVLDLGAYNFPFLNALGFPTTGDIAFEVPQDAIGFQIEGTVASGMAGLARLTGPGGEVFENSTLTGAYVWIPSRIFTAMVPNTDRPALQIPPGGGTWTLRLLRYSGSASSVAVRVLVQRRSAATAPYARLDLNVFLADGLSVSAATAPSDATLQGVLSGVDAILTPQGIRLGSVAYYDISDPAYDDVTSDAEFAELLQLSAAAQDTRLNLFFVNTALGSGVLGVAATIGGPAANGTELSGVMAKYSSSNVNLSALVAAHEIGHFVGLWHTVEQDGQHDFIDDTAECPASGTSTACPTAGGGYLMHWQAVGGTTVTDGQGLVVRGHPLLGPRPPPGTLRAKPAAAPVFDLEGVFVPEGWCATCERCRRVKGR